MKICGKDWSKKIEVKDRIQKTDGEDEETGFGLAGVVQSLRIFEEVVVDLVEEFARLEFGKRAVLKLHFQEWIWKLVL